MAMVTSNSFSEAQLTDQRAKEGPHRMVMENGGLQALFHVIAIYIRLNSVLFLWRVFLFASTSIENHHTRRRSTAMPQKAHHPSRLGARQSACFGVGAAINVKGTHCIVAITATDFQQEIT